MKVVQVHLGLLPIPPNGWGAIEKIIWDYHQQLNSKGLQCEIKYLNDIKYNDNTIVHVHVANLANECYERGIPYIFTLHDHHAFLYGKNSDVFKENLKAIENSIISTCPAKYLVDYFASKKLRYFSHAVNTDVFKYKNYNREGYKLLCVANNGYANNQSYDRKGFTYAIQAAKELNLPITIAGPSNNKKFFETLDPSLNNYEHLTKIFDLDENGLIELYNNHDIFIHASELEAGHPNLTLLEAMACGLPVVGTFENKRYDGMIVVDRDTKQIKDAINKVISNYEYYHTESLKAANNNSYTNRVDQLIELYNEYTNELFAKKFIDIYSNLNKNTNKVNNKVHVEYSFNDNAFVQITKCTNKDETFNVKFKNSLTDEVLYDTNLQDGWWGRCDYTYFIPYNLIVKSNLTNEIVLNYDLDLQDKNVLIEYETNALGDQLCWMPIAEQFRKKHKCNLFLKIRLRELFQNKYKDIKFINFDESVPDLFATYKPGWYVDNSSINAMRCKNDIRKQPLQKVASDYLGLNYVPERPSLDYRLSPSKFTKPYVTIATQSTAQAKYWNYKGGWNIIVDYLKSKGFDVVCIDKNSSFGNNNNMNIIPSNALDLTGNYSLEDRINQIYHSSFFIGLPSGLSWLAWSIGKPVTLISGFSHDYTEFETPYRVQNKNVCNGCWNDNYFDRGNWMWCPKPDKKEMFECTKSITPQMVIEKIDSLIKDHNL